MEGEKILMAAGVTVAAVVGAFVFWGPSGSSRLRQRRGQIAGLHNFGRTCFLNTLLQALAACPQFIAWLQLYNNASADKKSLITSLLNTLEVINGTHPTLRGDPYSPGAVIRALSTLGWVIPPDEHDAHELLHIVLTSLEEEACKPKKVGCLSDALEEGKQLNLMPPPRPSSAMLSDFLNADYDESTNLMRQVRSEAHTPDSPASMCDENDHENSSSMIDMDPTMSPNLNMTSRQSRARSIQPESGEALNKRVSMSCRSLERLSRGPGRVSIWADRAPMQVPHTFQGALGSQIVCNGCGFKSAVRYDKFDSITLNLPELRRAGLSIAHLLSDYITSENLTDVLCEGCNEKTEHTKSLAFAKLPPCLCLHISRTMWTSHGQVYKRQDYVHFPESLSMAPFSFAQPNLNSQANTPWGSTMSLYSSSVPLNNGDSFNNYTFGSLFPKNLYRLLAVVVHSGEANSGHFVTYRRGALRNSHRWYYTSDTNVREVSIDEVLSVPAYMLFYDRGPQRMTTVR